MVETLVRNDQRTDAVGIGDSFRARNWTLAVACMGVALVVASMTALNTALGDLAVATSATASQLNWVVDGYTVALACLLLPAGAIGDRYGRRGALLTGLLVFSIGSMAPALLHNPSQIIAGRAMAGIGAAFVMPATLSLLTVAYPKDDRTKAVGIWAGTAGSGGVLGMLGSGLLLRFWDWHAIFWSLGIAGLVIFALGCTVASSRDAGTPRVDAPGAVLIGAAVAIAVAAILEAPGRGWSDPLVWGGLAVGAVLAAAFGALESRLAARGRQPLLDVRLFADPNFATGVTAIVILFGATFGFFYIGMQYVQQIMGYSALTTAVAFGPFMVPLGIFSALSFWYVPKLGLRLVLFVGTLLMAVGFACMYWLDLHSTYLEFAWPTLILATGIGICTAPTTSAIMGAVPDEKQGVASAVNDSSREMGGALGIAVAGSILAGRYSHELAPGWRAFPHRFGARPPTRWPRPSRSPASSDRRGASWPTSASPRFWRPCTPPPSRWPRSWPSPPWRSQCGHPAATAASYARCGGCCRDAECYFADAQCCCPTADSTASTPPPEACNDLPFLVSEMYIDSYKSSLHGEVDVVLMGVTSVVEPACAAISEAAAIVEAEWMRLRRPSLPVRYPNCELPAARAARPRTTILVYTMPTRVMCSTSPRATTGRWPVSLVWARQRSPPLRQRLSQSGERRQLRKTKYGLSKNGVASVPSTNIATHCSRDAHLRAHSHLSWSSTWTA